MFVHHFVYASVISQQLSKHRGGELFLDDKISLSKESVTKRKCTIKLCSRRNIPVITTSCEKHRNLFSIFMLFIFLRLIIFFKH